MNKEEAKKILNQEMEELRSKSYQELTSLVRSPLVFERIGQTGAVYQIEVQAFPDDPRVPEGDIRVIASINDGRFLSFILPLSDDFIISPDGDFVGE